MGSSILSAESLDNYDSQLRTISKSLQKEGEILFYGCDVAQGTVGHHFVHRLGEITGAVVAASTDATGSSSLGGDWILEVSTGKAVAQSSLDPYVVDGYNALLSVTYDATTFENINGTGTSVTDGNFIFTGLDANGKKIKSALIVTGFTWGIQTIYPSREREPFTSLPRPAEPFFL